MSEELIPSTELSLFAEKCPLGDESPTTKNWLQHNIPEDICVSWKETSEDRIKELAKFDIQDIFKEWPRYFDSNGYQLIDIDFDTMFPGKSDLMFNKIESVEEAITKELFHSLIKDKLNLTYYDAMLGALVASFLFRLQALLSYKLTTCSNNPTQNLKEFYVCVDNIKYKVGSLIRAIDLVVKVSSVFNIEYSAKSKYVMKKWLSSDH
ncbi:uncharacterized protein LOC126754933 [Bactrocera neohumeralis]|uniref:uncharacterized protein LOC126754933 n=1 Tax=Bactrocera neohumeralis TaxID=98809 RepID=UPI0021654762|nr:uncharacterized protein LOC126754933 [Bactrocera neohumeralis]